MKLYGSTTSPYVRHCRVALMQNDMDFELIETDFEQSAKQSPTSKVPFMVDGDLTLTDSASILKYVREKSGQPFMADVRDYDLFTLASTLQDTAINVFIIGNAGFGADEIPYLGRQQGRIDSGLQAMNERIDPTEGISTDGALRSACFIGWGLFRERFEITGLDNLQGLMEAANADSTFAATAPA